MDPRFQSGEHASDVLSQIRDWQCEDIPSAIIVITEIVGGGVRAPGALMGVTSTESIGYISGGCIDADVILQARQALESGIIRALRYGAGSPFVDLPLPCGGSIELRVYPNPATSTISGMAERLDNRLKCRVTFSEDAISLSAHSAPSPHRAAFVATYTPKLQLRIAGRGADALSLANISRVAGYQTRLQLIDDEDVAEARRLGFADITKLKTPADLPASQDDEWTAFVLMFHERDWEVPLLRQALEGEAFYIGAVGSRKTHETRQQALQSEGLDAATIDRIRGPIGLIPSLRDASMLAVSVLAEIVEAYTSSKTQPRIALVLLAAGQSSRFERGDKLFADLQGQSILERSATTGMSVAADIYLAVTQPSQRKRSELLRTLGWRVIENPDAASGQSSSLRLAIEELARDQSVDQVLILLADMPHVPVDHLNALRIAAENEKFCAIMTETETVLTPPAVFKRAQFDALLNLTGDKGAKLVFLSLNNTATIPLDAEKAIDIDNVADLERATEFANA